MKYLLSLFFVFLISDTYTDISQQNPKVLNHFSTGLVFETGYKHCHEPQKAKNKKFALSCQTNIEVRNHREW